MPAANTYPVAGSYTADSGDVAPAAQLYVVDAAPVAVYVSAVRLAALAGDAPATTPVPPPAV